MPIRHLFVALILIHTQLSAALADDLQLATPIEFPSLSGGLEDDSDNDPFRGIDLVDISNDGRFLVFASPAPLVAGDFNRSVDIFLYDRDSGSTVLITRSIDDPSRSANGNSFNPRISADGSTVVFDSEATDLVTGISDSNDARDVFLWQRSTGQTFLVSKADGGGVTGNGASRQPRVSADGARVVFNSTATDLTADTDANGEDDVFLWQQPSDQTTLISESATSPGNTANRRSLQQGFSDDGEAVLIRSQAGDLIPGFVDQNFSQDDLFHWRSGNFQLVTRTTLGATTGSTREPFEQALSPDGQSVTFSHQGHDLVTGFIDGGAFLDLFQWQETSGETLLISHGPENILQGGDGSIGKISVSQDGEQVAFATGSRLVETDSVLDQDIYRWSRTTNSNQLISREFMFPLPANDESRRPRISRDGNTIVFDSKAHNLVSGFVPSAPFGSNRGQIYVWTSRSPIVLASRSTAGATHACDADVLQPWISPDGSAAYFFDDQAPDLVDNVPLGLFGFDISSQNVSLISSVFKPDLLNIAHDGRTDSIAISDDGRFVALDTGALGLIDGFVSSPAASEDVFLWDRLTGETTLVSRSIHDPNRGGDDTSQEVIISGDGRLVVFESRATDLIPGYMLPAGASSNSTQIYAWNRLTGETKLLSRNAASPTMGADDSHSTLPVVAADGSFVVFQSEAPDLVAGGNDSNGAADLFGWDPATDTVSLITVGSGGPSSANGPSNTAALSADGQFLAFRSGATDLIPGLNDTNGRRDVFLWQRSTGAFTLVNHVAGDPSTTSVRGGEDVDISGDGNTVAFFSSASDLISGVDGNGWWNIYVWDRLTGNKRWVSRSLATPGVSGDGDSQTPKLSFDGQAVIFRSDRADLSTDVTAAAQDQLFHWDAATDELTTISRSAQSPGLSAGRVEDAFISNDGSKVCFESTDPELLPTGTGFPNQIYYWDRSIGELALVSHSVEDPQGPGNGSSQTLACSRDGSSVVITNSSEDAVSGAVPRNLQTYVWRPNSSADLHAAWASPALPVPTGEPVRYTLSVTNESANLSTATKAVITLPAGSAFLQVSGAGWGCKNAGQLLSCRRIGPLAAGETTELILDIAAPGMPGNDCIHGSVIWPGTDPDLSDNTVEVCTDFAPDDWGDAPDPGYPTLARSGGASHGFSDLFLGASVAVDVNGQPSPTADGDDTDGSSDEDGVVLPPLVVGQSGDLQVTASGPGLLDAYFDWNADGDWDDPGEKALDGQSVVAGSNTISLATPAGALTGPTFARFRLSSVGTTGPGGRAADGEVEDYAVTVDSIGLTATLTVDPSLVPEVGGPATFTLRLDNPGTQNAVITSLVDDLAGDLNGLGSCAAPQTLGPAGFYQCEYTLSLSGPVDATETHTVSANGSSLGFALAAEDGASVTFFDSIAPDLPVYATSEGQLVGCDTLQQSPDALWVTFSEQLEVGPGGADDPTSYSLVAAGPDSDFGTVGCGPAVGDDQSIPLGVTYVPGPDRFDPSTAQLMPTAPLADGLYRLFTCDGLQDLGNNPVPGTDLAVQFRVDDGNLFDNGHFDCDLGGWQPDPSGAVHDLTDVDDSPQSGSLAVFGSGGLSLALDQCVPVPGGQSLTFEVSIRFDDMSGSVVGLARSCAFFADGACTGLAAESFQLDLLEDTSGFVERSFELQIPPGASSAACGFAVDSLTDGSWDLYLDAASLRQAADIFVDGFESGNTSAWSSNNP